MTMEEKGQEFIRKAEALFPEYDYSEVIYKGTRPKVTIICPIHGSFQKSPYLFLKGSECVECKKRKKKEEFDNKVSKVMDIFVGMKEDK
jgi:hypothetical protein